MAQVVGSLGGVPAPSCSPTLAAADIWGVSWQLEALLVSLAASQTRKTKSSGGTRASGPQEQVYLSSALSQYGALERPNPLCLIFYS